MAKAKQSMPADVRDAVREVIRKNPDAFVQSFCNWQHMGDENTESGKPVRAEYNHDQAQIFRIRRMHERRGVAFRGILGKARQRGLSTGNVYRAHVSCMATDGRKTIFVAHREDRAVAFMDKVRYMRSQWPEWFRNSFPLNHDSDFKMSYKEWQSFQWIMSVFNVSGVDMARGETPHEILGTEWTRWRNFIDTLTEVQSSCHMAPNTALMLESTLKGRGTEAHQFWLDCKAGRQPYTAHWLAWQDDPASHLNYWEWGEALQRERMGEVADYERELIRRGLQYNLSVGQVWQSYLWLKNVKLGKWDRFIEDYPLDDDEAWQALGYLYFEDNEIIRVAERLKEPVCRSYQLETLELEDGFTRLGDLHENSSLTHLSPECKLIIFESPAPGGEYVVGAFPTAGNQSSSPASAHVINKLTGAMVAAVHGVMKPHQFGQILNSLGHLYNDAVMAPNVRSSEGLATLAELTRLNYPRMYRWKAFDDIEQRDKNKSGWWTDRVTSTLTLNLLARVLEQSAIGGSEIHKKLIRDPGVTYEMGTFIEDQETRIPGPCPNCHDTRIVSLAIAWYVADMETRGHDISALNSLRPCQILTSAQTIRNRPEVSSVILTARDFIQKKLGSFVYEQEEW